VTRADFVLAPDASEELCKVICQFSPSAPEPFTLTAVLGVRGAPPLRVTLGAAPDDVRVFVEDLLSLSKPVAGTPIKMLG